MKITDPDIIKNGEQDLINAVTGDLDLDAVKQILKDRLKTAPLNSSGGEIVVHDNQIAFRLDFDIQLSGSLLFDREGNYIAPADAPPEPQAAQEAPVVQEKPEVIPEPEPEPEAAAPVEEEELEIDLPEPEAQEAPQDELVELDLDDEELEAMDLDAPDADALDDPLPMEDDLDIDLPDFDDDELLEDSPLEEEEAAAEPQEAAETAPGPDSLPPDEELQEKMLNDDINDIIKESREFWEKKKKS